MDLLPVTVIVPVVWIRREALGISNFQTKPTISSGSYCACGYFLAISSILMPNGSLQVDSMLEIRKSRSRILDSSLFALRCTIRPTPRAARLHSSSLQKYMEINRARKRINQPFTADYVHIPWTV